MTSRRLVTAALLAACLSGCVAPAVDTSDYESKATSTAQAAVSAARTAVLTTTTYDRGRLPVNYLEPVLVDAEDTLGSVLTTFDSVQPPATSSADAMRAELDPLLQRATSAVTDMRIAARRRESSELTRSAGALARVADRLESFAREHSR